MLVVVLAQPWRKSRAKPLGGRAGASHVGCYVFFIVVFYAVPSGKLRVNLLASTKEERRK